MAKKLMLSLNLWVSLTMQPGHVSSEPMQASNKVYRAYEHCPESARS